MDLQTAAKLPFNLKIIPTTINGFPAGVPFIAMFNPESFAVNETVCWNAEATPAAAGAAPVFIRVNPREFTIEFMLDGTGVNTNGIKIPVTAQVALFRGVTTNIRGTIHRPSYLMVQYGPFINVCVLKSSAVTYTMFDILGLPIRAKISASFVEHSPPGLSNVLGMLSSPDLTHEVITKEFDLLPLLTYKIYNNQNYYLQVAKANRLKNFRNIKKGTVLKFFPIGK